MRGVGTGYVTSPMADVKHWFHVLRKQPDFKDRVFVDIGCGEGHVLGRWAKLLKTYNIKQELAGIEFDRRLLADGSAYLRRDQGGINARLFWSDAAHFEYASFGKPLIAWMFYPFNEDTLRDWSTACNGTDVWVVMNNPEHALALLNKGWYMQQSLVREWPHNSWFWLWNGGHDE